MADSTTRWCRLLLARQTVLNSHGQLRGHVTRT